MQIRIHDVARARPFRQPTRIRAKRPVRLLEVTLSSLDTEARDDQPQLDLDLKEETAQKKSLSREEVLAIRNAAVWGDAGTACASDSTKFGA